MLAVYAGILFWLDCSKENSFDNQGVATTSAIVQNTQQQDRPESNTPADVEMSSVVASEPSPPEHIGSSSRIPEEVGVNAARTGGDGQSWKDIALDNTPGDIKKVTAGVVQKPAEDPKAKAQSQTSAAPPMPNKA